MGGGNGDNASKATGFAALGDLSSVAMPAKAEPEAPAIKPEAPASAEARASPPAPEPTQTGPYQGQQASVGGRSGKGKVIAVVLVGLGALWMFSGSNNHSGRPTSASTNSPAYTPSPPLESAPPIGTGLLLERDKVRYCVAEDIRLDGAKTALNHHNQFDVDRFNGMIADYNSRCSSFRYRQGVLESVRREAEADRFRLEAQGAARF